MSSMAAAGFRSRRQSLRRSVLRERAGVVSAPGRRGLQVCLGLVWLLDAGLQFQPYMFGPFFVTQVIQPTTAGNPAVVASSVTWVSELMLRHIAVFNGLFAAIQLLIAVGLLFARTLKPALAASILWALFVWWFGESLGGIFPGTSPLAGLPGGAVLYALIALLLWPTPATGQREPAAPARSGLLGSRGANLAWLALWGSFCCFLLLPQNRAPDAIAQIFAFTDGQPGWLTAIMNGLSGLAIRRGAEISLGLAVLCAFAAAGVLSPRLTRPALIAAGALGLLFWIAEGLGGIFTGQGTDPNSGPLLMLLAACFWPRSRRGGQAPMAVGDADALAPSLRPAAGGSAETAVHLSQALPQSTQQRAGAGPPDLIARPEATVSRNRTGSRIRVSGFVPIGHSIRDASETG
jgi:hypothetical protein